MAGVGCLIPGNQDTPRYYYATGRSAEGDATLSRLYAKPLSDAAVARSKGDILASIELEKVATASLRLKDFFYDTSDLQAARRIRTGVFLVGIGYMIGTDMIYYYLSTIFQAYIGLPATTASAMSAVATTVLTVTNFLGATFMERFGRRTWLIGKLDEGGWWVARGCGLGSPAADLGTLVPLRRVGETKESAHPLAGTKVASAIAFYSPPPPFLHLTS